jgi:hypothetical protein
MFPVLDEQVVAARREWSGEFEPMQQLIAGLGAKVNIIFSCQDGSIGIQTVFRRITLIKRSEQQTYSSEHKRNDLPVFTSNSVALPKSVKGACKIYGHGEAP